MQQLHGRSWAQECFHIQCGMLRYNPMFAFDADNSVNELVWNGIKVYQLLKDEDGAQLRYRVSPLSISAESSS